MNRKTLRRPNNFPASSLARRYELHHSSPSQTFDLQASSFGLLLFPPAVPGQRPPLTKSSIRHCCQWRVKRQRDARCRGGLRRRTCGTSTAQRARGAASSVGNCRRADNDIRRCLAHTTAATSELPAAAAVNTVQHHILFILKIHHNTTN